MSVIAVLDFEGTSRLASARATEIGIVSLARDLTIESQFESLVKSPVRPDKTALSVSRLSNREIDGAPSFEELWPLVRFQLSGKVLVAHNKIYEINVLRNELSSLSISELPPFLCTLEWSRKILGLKVRNHTLPTLCEYFDIELDHAHEAIADARATAHLLQRLADLSPELGLNLQKLESLTLDYREIRQAIVQPKVRERFQTENGNTVSVDEAFQRVSKFNQTLVVVTGTPDDGKEEFGTYVSSAGLEYRETPPTKSTAFVVQSNNNPGMSKIRRALELGIPVLSESDALLLIKMLRGEK
jgi:DNA polymerase-3 subunit epsilon